jgi:hypothetical protein
VAVKRRNRDRMGWIAASFAVVLLVASLAWIAVHLRNEPAPSAMVKFQIPVPDQMRFTAHQLPAVSPAGQCIAFTAIDGRRRRSILEGRVEARQGWGARHMEL